MFGFFKSSPPPASAIEPDAQRMRADALLQELEWAVIRRIDGLLQGDYRTLMRGSGLDLADLREYQHHDDVRHIDWNVTARLQQPHVRVFTEDREMCAWFLLDLSPSIDFGSDTQRKSQVLMRFVAVLARLMSRHGNRVGAMLYGAHGLAEVNAVLPARGGRVQVLRLLDQIDRAQTDQTARRHVMASTAKGKSTQLADLLTSAATTMRQRGTVFVVSDFISEPGWERPLGELARRHDVVAVRLYDPLEMQLPDIGLLTLSDAETGEQLLVDTHDRGFRERFVRLAAEREATLRESLARAGVDTLELATNDDLADAVLRFVDLRRQRQNRSAGGQIGRWRASHLSVSGSVGTAQEGRTS